MNNLCKMYFSVDKYSEVSFSVLQTSVEIGEYFFRLSTSDQTELSSKIWLQRDSVLDSPQFLLWFDELVIIAVR